MTTPGDGPTGQALLPLLLSEQECPWPRGLEGHGKSWLWEAEAGSAGSTWPAAGGGRAAQRSQGECSEHSIGPSWGSLISLSGSSLSFLYSGLPRVCQANPLQC